LEKNGEKTKKRTAPPMCEREKKEAAAVRRKLFKREKKKRKKKELTICWFTAQKLPGGRPLVREGGKGNEPRW